MCFELFGWNNWEYAAVQLCSICFEQEKKKTEQKKKKIEDWVKNLDPAEFHVDPVKKLCELAQVWEQWIKS